MASGENPTLYRRMGGYDVIAGVIDDFLGRFRSDPKFARFGMGRSLDSIQRARQLIVDQMCALAGGPCLYAGRDMKTSHAGLAITEAEWRANMEYAAAALDKFGIGAREKEEFLEIFRKYKNDIVEKP
ncbi:MAG: group 1 truncated hemoglobin [Acidobacteriia bacterium]|nr:group 1 truncated hemoglobin [Terriglobia bacterium]